MGIAVGGTNTDATLVFTPAPRTVDNAEVFELLESWAYGDIGELLCAGLKACAPPLPRSPTTSHIASDQQTTRTTANLTIGCLRQLLGEKTRSKTVYCGPSLALARARTQRAARTLHHQSCETHPAPSDGEISTAAPCKLPGVHDHVSAESDASPAASTEMFFRTKP